MDRADAERLLVALHDAQNELYGGGDPSAVVALLDVDIAWHVPGDAGVNAIAGDYVGREAVLAYMRRRRDLAGSSMRMHPRELLVGDADHVASRTDGSAVIDGTEHRWSTIGLYRLDPSATRILECWLLPLDQAVFDRVWVRRV